MNEILANLFRELKADKINYKNIKHQLRLIENDSSLAKNWQIETDGEDKKTLFHLVCLKGDYELTKLFLSMMDKLPEQKAGQTGPKDWLPLNGARERILRLIELHQATMAEAEKGGIQFNRTLYLVGEAKKSLGEKTQVTRPAILLFGHTGSGKTTYLNFLLGTNYEFRRNGLRRYCAKVDGAEEQGAVGNAAISETTFPLVFESETLSYALIDLPGVCDNRSKTDTTILSPYAVTAALGLKLLSKKLKEIQSIVVFCELQKICDARSLDVLLQPFREVGRIIGQKKTLEANVVLAITNHAQQDYTEKEVLDRLGELKKNFPADKHLQVFLNMMIDGAGKILQADATCADSREAFFKLVGSILPQPKDEFDFSAYSAEWDRFEGMISDIRGKRATLAAEIKKLENEISQVTAQKEERAQPLNRALENLSLPENANLPIDFTDLLKEARKFEIAISGLLDGKDGLTLRLQVMDGELEEARKNEARLFQLKENQEVENDYFLGSEKTLDGSICLAVSPEAATTARSSRKEEDNFVSAEMQERALQEAALREQSQASVAQAAGRAGIFASTCAEVRHDSHSKQSVQAAASRSDSKDDVPRGNVARLIAMFSK